MADKKPIRLRTPVNFTSITMESNKDQLVKDADNFLDLQLNFADRVKGDDDNDVQQKCLNICQKYLSGIWSELNLNGIEVKRLTGGMSNKIYHCKVGHLLKEADNEHQEVVVRFYGIKPDWTLGYNTTDGRLDESIVGLLASEKGIGGKVYGIFNEGQLQKYYPHRLFTIADLDDPRLLSQLAIKLARFHAMEIPIGKDYELHTTFFSSLVRKLNESPEKFKKLFEEYKCNSLLDCDMSSELNWILELIPTFNSPKVFAHNDFRLLNTMISDDNEVILGDFETSCYYYRGLDFATVFDDIDHKDGHKAVKGFITEYLREGEKIFGKSYSENPNNSVDHILKEMKLFSMVVSLFYISIFLNNDVFECPFEEKTCMSVANNLMGKYLATKKFLIESKII